MPLWQQVKSITQSLWLAKLPLAIIGFFTLGSIWSWQRESTEAIPGIPKPLHGAFFCHGTDEFLIIRPEGIVTKIQHTEYISIYRVKDTYIRGDELIIVNVEPVRGLDISAFNIKATRPGEIVVTRWFGEYASGADHYFRLPRY